jgi:4-amino-4-deoxy-L-arabinose transferase-like glycosyltransferase
MQTASKSGRESLPDGWCSAALLAFALLLWLLALGNLPLRDWDEGTRALVAREIYRTGHWLHPTLYGEPYLLKPPLMDWLVALAYRLGGVNEWTSRLPGAIATACGVPLLYHLGRSIFSAHRPALLAAAVYLTLLPVLRHGRLLMLDGMAVTAFLLLLLGLYRSVVHRRWAIAIGLGLGAIALTKGLLVFPLAAIAILGAIRQIRRDLLGNRWLWLGLGLGAIPVAAWYVAQLSYYGEAFWQAHFQTQGFDRLSQAVETNSGPLWFYGLELLKYSWPWLLFWPGGFALAWQQRQTRWGELILLGTGFYLGTISLMSTKLPWYVMPVYPFIALAVGMQLEHLWQHKRPYGTALIGALALLTVAFAAGEVYLAIAEPEFPLLTMGFVLCASAGCSTWQATCQKPIFISILFAGTYVGLACFVLSDAWVWELNEAFSVGPVAELVSAYTPPGATIYTSFAYQRPSLDFYSDRRIVSAAAERLSQQSASYLLLEESALQALKVPESRRLGSRAGFTLVAPALNR